MQRLETGGLLGDPEGSADGPLGIVTMSDRHTEDTDDGVADEFLNDPAVQLDLERATWK